MKRLVRYTQTRLNRLAAGLEKYHQFQEEDSLHRIRVELKKLRAVIKVVGYANPKLNVHEMFWPMRHLFKKAGLVRHPAVLLELMKAHGVTEIPVTRTFDVETTEDKLKAEVSFYLNALRKLNKRLPGLLKELSRQDVRRYVRKREKLIRRIFVPRLIPEKLHLARKHMKQVYYLTGLVPVMDNKHREAYSRMEEVIGSLHDKELLLALLARVPRGIRATQLTALKKSCAADRRAVASMAKKLYRSRSF